MTMSSDLVRVYNAASAIEGHFLKGGLERHGIPAKLLGEEIAGTFGELPAIARHIDICVDDANVTELPSADRSWRCASCNEENPAIFDFCWNCQESAQD